MGIFAKGKMLNPRATDSKQTNKWVLKNILLFCHLCIFDTKYLNSPRQNFKNLFGDFSDKGSSNLHAKN